ncbi:alpha-2-macroglobulin family protein [Desulfosarcina sp. OttesenSCG-928-G10]|nr:alpha-2-macroglobulin family protein [Desulfosarcina sp. OttesenSCG-928-G10]
MTPRPLFSLLLVLFMGISLAGYGQAQTAAATDSKAPALSVIDVSEVQTDGASTLLITFSTPIKKDQKFSKLLSLVDAKSGKVDGAWELKDNGMELFLRYLEPDRELSLAISPRLAAENNRQLDTEFTTTLNTRPITPSASFASTGVLLPLRLSDGLPVITLNVNQVDIDFFRVRDTFISDFLKDWRQSSVFNLWTVQHKLKNQTDLVFTGRFDLNPAANKRETAYLPVADIRQLREPGIYFAVMRQTANYTGTLSTTLFVLSDIGISLHRYDAAMRIFSQSLETGKPLADVDLILFDALGKHLATARTDRNGHARLPGDTEAKGLLARKGKETTLLMLTAPALDLSEFAVAGPVSSPLQFFVFSPRDLYRPGETVLLNGLLRDRDGKEVPPQPVKVTMQQPDGKTASTFTWSPDKDNFYHYALQLPISAPTGRWQLLVDAGNGKPVHHEFLVEDFLPERMGLDISGHDGPLLKDDALRFKVQGRYLYGAPASGNLVTSGLFVGFLREAVPGLPGYQFGSVTEKAPYSFVTLPDMRLNADGETEIIVANQWGEVKSPLWLTCQASLQESGGRSVTRRFSHALWPAGTLPGIRGIFTETGKTPEGNPCTAPSANVKFEIVLADMGGNKLAAEALRVRLIRERRDYYWFYTDRGGWNYRFDEKFLTLFDDGVRIEEGGIAEISFPVEWGPYRVEVEDPTTGLVSSVRFWAGYSWQNNAKEGASRPDQITMVLDKPAYNAGDKAHVTLTPPAAGSGYLMVESSDGPLWWQAIQVPAAGKTFSFSIPADWARHDLYVSALVVRPGDKKAFQTPKRAVGLLHLPLDRKDRKLDLTLTAPEKIRPNGPLTLQVRATDASGNIPQNATVLISAVDAGILNITDFKTPDPFDCFFGRKAYSADQLDIYGSIIEAGKGTRATLAFGGDAQDMRPTEKTPDTPVLIVALQSSALSFDESGMAQVTLDIPDFNGTLRLMAQAWTTDQYGMTEGETRVAAPLVMELSMPRFLADGDEAQLALDLSNLSGQPQELSLDLWTQGTLSLDGKLSKIPVSIAPGERKTLVFMVRAAGGLSTGLIKALVSGLKLPEGETVSAEKTWQLGIRPPWPAEIQQYGTTLRPGESWSLPPERLASFFAESREALLKVSSAPALNLARQIQSLRAYPYGCLEQTTSGIYPFLYANEATLNQLGIKGDTDNIRRDKIYAGITRILDIQRSNGSFGTWSRGNGENFWVTVYATDFLLRAREEGFDVPEDVLKKITDRIRHYLNSAQRINPDYVADVRHLRFAVQAYAGYVLARTRQAPIGTLRDIYDRKDEARSGLSLVQLGIALHLMGDAGKGNELITQGIHDTLNPADSPYVWRGDYGSHIRDTAMVYALLSEHHLAEKDRDALLFRLSDAVMKNRGLSTQERNAVFLAGRFLLSRPERSDWAVALTAGNETIELTDKAPGRRLVDEQMTLPVTITNTSEQTLHTEFSFSAYPRNAPSPVSNQMRIQREFLSLEGQLLDLSKLKSGDMVLVHLTVSAYNRIADGLVVDFLPAGLELENQNLQNAAVSLKDAGAQVRKFHHQMKNTTILHQEFRADRYVAAVDLREYGNAHLLYLARAVTPGRYTVPPPTVHSMYRPEWQAIGASTGPLVVSPRN